MIAQLHRQIVFAAEDTHYRELVQVVDSGNGQMRTTDGSRPPSLVDAVRAPTQRWHARLWTREVQYTRYSPPRLQCAGT